MMMLAMSAQSRSENEPQEVTPQDDTTSLLVARAADGDQEAWRALATQYGRRLYALARSRLHDDQLAEDIAQSVFVTLAQKLKGPEGKGYKEQGRFESWLFRIAMNRVRDVIRKQQRRPEILTDAPARYAADASQHHQAADTTEDLDDLRRAMQSLGDLDREVVELRHHAELSFKQIAEAQGQPIGTVLARHHRALRKLRDMIESKTTQPATDGVQP